MAEYSELIKRFDKVRDYMRDFYVYGFKSRQEFGEKSLRTYDNEKRRIEGYLGEFLSFRQDENGKNVFISVDSASISENPLYRAFKAKTFTKNDISLHFILLDILTYRVDLTVMQIADIVATDYMSFFESGDVFEASTIRNKLREYETFGIVRSKRRGKEVLYSLLMNDVNVEDFVEAFVFFSEVSPLGVIGSYLLDKTGKENEFLSFKHHYIMQALDSEVRLQLLEAMHQKRRVEIESYHQRARKIIRTTIIPVKILMSVGGGRQYICGFDDRTRKFDNFRIDYIKSVKSLCVCEEFDQKRVKIEEILRSTWGISYGNGKCLEQVRIIFHIEPKEEYIIRRIHREGRGGTLTQVDHTTYEYRIEVYDAREMLTWIRSFIGRIKSFECSNKNTQKIFYDDLNTMYTMYGGGLDDI